MKTKNEIIDYIKQHGNRGAEAVEKYVDVDTEGIVDDGLDLAQLCYFEDTNDLLAYLLDEDFNGYWRVYDHLEKENREKLENSSIWG